MTVKRLICLANSRKPGGRCVAGLTQDGGEWIRPVSERDGQEVSAAERQYRDGSEPALLDIVEMSLERHSPGEHQPENWTLDASSSWERVGCLPVGDLEPHAQEPSSLWTNDSSSGDGINDRVRQDERVDRSLYLIRVDDLVVDTHSVPTPYGSETKLKGEFRLNGTTYRLAITDPGIESTYLARTGRHELGAAYLTVSLGEPFHGYHYKLIAGVMLIREK